MKAPLHPAYRRDIDGLRAIAILCVIGFHAFPQWCPGGFVGVDIFFVISGYLISSILLSNLAANRFSLGDFYMRRIRRIFPALIAVLSASFIFGFVILWPDEYRQLGKHLAGGAGFVANLLFEQETGYFAGRAETKPLLHLWSLGVEEQFYIFWPLMLAAAWKWKHRAGLIIAATILTSFAINIQFARQDSITDFFSPLSRFWELLIGGALAWLAQHKIALKERNASEVAAIVGATLIVLATFLMAKDMPFPDWRALIPVIGAVLIIAAGQKTLINRYALSNRIMVSIGLISYPLYLWHWPLLSFGRILNGEDLHRSQRIALVVSAFVLAGLTYWFIEKPIRTGALNKRRVFILLGLMATLGTAGFGIYWGNGLPGRFAQYAEAVQKLDSRTLIENWQNEVRLGTCHMQDPAQTEPSSVCIETKHPLILLWGDSHAASLYPGLKALQENDNFGIAQMTQAGCPPLVDLKKLVFRKNCNQINKRILTDLPALKPDLILLSAAWLHPDYPMTQEELLDKLKASIATISHAAPQAKIIVIGSEPRWLSPVPAFYRHEIAFHHFAPPQYSEKHRDLKILSLDDAMRETLEGKGITYLSPRQVMCNASGCLTRMAEPIDTIAYLDDEHITASASVALISQFAPDILKALGN